MDSHKNKGPPKAAFYFWIPLPLAAPPLGVKLLGGDEFCLRQGFAACRRQALIIFKQAPFWGACLSSDFMLPYGQDYSAAISAATLSSQERMASKVFSISASSSQPRRSAPVIITSREQPAANY